MELLIMEDQELVKVYQSGNESAFEVLLMRHKNRVYNYIYSKIRDHALSQDIFQDVFVKIIQTLKKEITTKKENFFLGLCVLRTI